MLKLNPDINYVSAIMEGIVENDGYCACQFLRNKKTKCPLVNKYILLEEIYPEELCINGAEIKECICGVYE